MSEHTIAAPTSEAMQELGRAWPEWYTAAMYCCSQALLVPARPHSPRASARGWTLPNPSCLLHSPLPANLTGISPTALRLIWCMWMPTVWAAQPMRRGRTPSGRLLDELESLGLDEELEDPGENTVVLMEWGEQMATALAPERLEIHIDRPLDSSDVASAGSDGELTSNGTRTVAFVPVGKRWAAFDLQ